MKNTSPHIGQPQVRPVVNKADTPRHIPAQTINHTSRKRDNGKLKEQSQRGESAHLCDWCVLNDVPKCLRRQMVTTISPNYVKLAVPDITFKRHDINANLCDVCWSIISLHFH